MNEVDKKSNQSSGEVQPTVSDLHALAERALRTAEEAKQDAKSAAQTKRDVEDDVRKVGESHGFQIGEDEAKMIAEMTISQLEARGAFSRDDGGALESPEDGETLEPSVDAKESAVSEPVETIENEAAPRPKTLAERFQGK